MAIYRGLSGVNREVKQQYRGLSAVNRTIKEQYRGLSGVNRKVFVGKPLGALYWEGDECTALTGGWSITYTYNANSAPTIEASYMIGVYADRGWDLRIGYRTTAQSVDVTPYSKLWYEVENNEAGYILLTKWNHGYQELTGGVVVQVGFANTEFSAGAHKVGYADLSTTNRAVFPVFNPYRHLKLHKLWLE